jgi:hypothetical protein
MGWDALNTHPIVAFQGGSKVPETISFVNLICRFGDKLVLLDLANEIVLPSFTDSKMSRKYGVNTYIFQGVDFIEIAGAEKATVPLLVLYGRLIKDTLLTRDQVYTPEGGLERKPGSLPSAPSSFFALILNNHKLMYVPETGQAPSLGAFQATLQYFLGIKYREYINAQFQARRSGPEPISKKQLYYEIPHPMVAVVPLSSRESIQEFLRKFERIKRLEFKILPTNQEWQMGATFEAIRQMRKSLDARDTKLVHQNPAGLDKQNVDEQVNEAAATGNSEVELTGTTPEGDRLKGNNQDFSLQVPAAGLPERDIDRAVRLVNLFNDFFERGIISGDVAEDTDDKIRRVRRPGRDDA